MLINNIELNPTNKKYNITRYNISCADFDIDGIRKIKTLIKRNYSFVQLTPHFEDKKNSYGIKYFATLNKILAHGRCFEYKLLDNKYIYRMAIRVPEKDYDTIYVLEPIYIDGGIFVKYVTVYICKKGDYHLIKRYK